LWSSSLPFDRVLSTPNGSKLATIMRFSETRCEQNNAVRPHDFALVGTDIAAALAERPKVINRVLPVTEHYFSKLGNGSVKAGFNLGGESHLLSFVVVVVCHAARILVFTSQSIGSESATAWRILRGICLLMHL